jgi:DNA-binding transcriptional LysR family regulator
VEVQSRITTDNSEIQLGAVLAGMGVSATAPFQVTEYLRRGELVRLLPDWRVVHQHGVFAVVPHRSYTPGRVEAVRDAVARHLERLEREWRTITE